MTDQPIPYETAREELIDVVRKLEAGGTSLADSMQLWERGEKLAATCERWLDGAQERVERARQQGPTAAGSTPHSTHDG